LGQELAARTRASARQEGGGRGGGGGYVICGSQPVFSTRERALLYNPRAHTNDHEKKEKTAAPTASKPSGEFGFEGLATSLSRLVTIGIGIGIETRLSDVRSWCCE
jgi:hypothetical protein